MRHRLIVLLVGAFLTLLTGCEKCEDRTVEYEAVYADPFYDATLALVESQRGAGYDCTSTNLRNGAGTVIGAKYTCTKCQ